MSARISNCVTRTVAATVLLFASSCTTARTSQSNATAKPRAVANAEDAECHSGMPAYNPTPAQVERDEIFTLLAYAVVRKDWQTGGQEKPRGYNIGSVLVDSEDKIACWARNTVGVTYNKTQHGEVRLMTNYLQNISTTTSLPGYKLYTTLEPCAMCSGMMTLQSVHLTVYGQTDPGFGGALERLEFDSTSCGGYAPYPRGVISVPSTSNVRKNLDDAYAEAPRGITRFLAGEEAKKIYDNAYDEFMNYSVSYPSNRSTLEAARAFLAAVPDSYTAIPYKDSCPPQ